MKDFKGLDSSIDTLWALLREHHEREPKRLEAEFPHILRKIALLWPDTHQTRTYLKSLMVTERDGRQGFPPDVYMEIFALSNLHDRLNPLPKMGADCWSWLA